MVAGDFAVENYF